MGPQHPSTHGVFRAAVILDGETIVSLKPVMGYLHRNHEKIGERNTFLQNMPYTDRLDYFNSMSNNWGYSLAVEKLMNIQAAGTRRVPPRDHGGTEPHPEPPDSDRHAAQRPGRLSSPRLCMPSRNAS